MKNLHNKIFISSNKFFMSVTKSFYENIYESLQWLVQESSCLWQDPMWMSPYIMLCHGHKLFLSYEKIFSIRNTSWWKYLKWHTNSTIKSSIPIRGFFMTLLVFKSKYSTIDYLVLASLIQISFQMIWRKNLLIHAISLLKFFRFSCRSFSM